MHRIVTASKELQVYQYLEGRRYFSREEQTAFYRARQGFEGERKLFNILQGQLDGEHIAIYGLLLNNHGTVFQLDCVVIFSRKVVMLEVKNHQGEFEFHEDRFYRITNDKYYPNPMHQLQRSDVNLREVLSNFIPGVPLESYVMFVHQAFTLFTERTSTIRLPSQIKSFIRTFNQTPGKIKEQHRVLAAQLVAAHMEDSPHIDLPGYHFDQLRKGVLCRDCRSSMQLLNRRLYCQQCSYQEFIDSGLLRNVIEFQTLFPDFRITTTNIAAWCALGISDKSIRRILKAYLYHQSYNNKSYFEFYRNVQD